MILDWSYRRQKGGNTPRTFIPIWTLPLGHISSSLGMVRPFTNGVETGWKKCTDSMVDQFHSMTRAYPPLALENKNNIRGNTHVGSTF